MWAMGKGRKDAVGLHRYLPYFVSWSWVRGGSTTVRPLFSIIANSVLTLIVSALPFNFVVKLYFLVRVVNLVFEYAALVWLKYKEPQRPRPFSVPGGTLGALALCMPTLAIALLAVITSGIDDWTVPVCGAATVVGIAILYPFKIFWVWVSHKMYQMLSKTVLM